MIKDSLFELIQNNAISAIALHSFTFGYYNVAKNRQYSQPYPRLEYTFYVLPIVYNQVSMEIFKSSNELYRVLFKDQSIILGLQDRANKMSKQTFDSLNIAFSKNILTYNKDNKTVELLNYRTKTLPLYRLMNNENNSVKNIRESAHKLGLIFAKKDPINIQLELNIRF